MVPYSLTIRHVGIGAPRPAVRDHEVMEEEALQGERVYVEHHWYDGPRGGIADVDGVPHYFESLDDYAKPGEWDDLYFVWPVPPGVLEKEQRQWQLWIEWHDQLRAGLVAPDTHPGRTSGSEYATLDAQLQEHRSAPAHAVIRAATWWYPPGAPARYTTEGVTGSVVWASPD